MQQLFWCWRVIRTTTYEREDTTAALDGRIRAWLIEVEPVHVTKLTYSSVLLQVRLLLANQCEDDILLREQLEALAAKHPNFKLWYTLDRCVLNACVQAVLRHKCNMVWRWHLSLSMCTHAE
jgi:hypothetical protein